MMASGQSVDWNGLCTQDTPGFIVNRLLIPYLAEAVRMLERGTHTAYSVPTPPGKSWKNFLKSPGPGESWKITLVLESPGN